MKRKPTLMALVAGECANHRNAACVGANVPLADRPGPFTMELSRCLVAMGLPCDYFEQCVLPLARKRAEFAGAESEYARKVNRLFLPDVFGKVRLAAALDAVQDEGLRQRLWRHPFIVYARGTEPAKRVCPECRAPLQKGARLCELCRQKRAKETARERQRRRRGLMSRVV